MTGLVPVVFPESVVGTGIASGESALAFAGSDPVAGPVGSAVGSGGAVAVAVGVLKEDAPAAEDEAIPTATCSSRFRDTNRASG